MNCDQFDYLSLYKNQHDEYIYICLKFILKDSQNIEFINCYQDVDAKKDFTKDEDLYTIKGEFENTHVVKTILKEINRMVEDRRYNDSTVTDRVGYFGMLVSALHQFQY